MPTESNLYLALEGRFAAPEWALFRNVPPGTGAAARYADAIAMNLWASRGLKFLGFEIKVRRSDWLRELKDPAKAEAMAKLCDEWWLVTSADVVKDEAEVPERWGWLCCTKNGKTLRLKRKAKPLKKQRRTTYEDVPRPFVAAILRRAHEAMENGPERRDAYSKGFDAGEKSGRSATEWASEKRILEQKIRAAEQHVALYEKAKADAGLGSFDSWDFPRLAEHVALLHANGPNRVVQSYTSALRNLDSLRTSIAKAIDEFKNPPADVVGQIDSLLAQVEAGTLDDDLITVLTKLRASATTLETP